MGYVRQNASKKGSLTARGARVSLFCAALLTAGHARAYNTEEHKLITDMGAADVTVDSSITLRNPTRFVTAGTGVVLALYRSAKNMAVAFATNDSSDFSPFSICQDNAYRDPYQQLKYNKALWIPTGAYEQYLRNRLLQVTGRVAGTDEGFSIGELVALYGDYRRTCYCPDGNCELTNANTTSIGFFAGDWLYRPNPRPADQYLRSVASGLVPPFLASSTTADSNKYSESGWWGDERMRIANVNDWHFSEAAVAWYAGMHRIALNYVNLARSNPQYWNAALHYEANALHSLTDLFAFGHVVVSRGETAQGIMADAGLLDHWAYVWQQNALAMGGGMRLPSGRVLVSANLPDTVFETPHLRNDFMASYPGAWSGRVDRERALEERYNESGARVRNLNGSAFYIYGNGKLKVTPDDSKEQMAKSVATSLQSLFDAYMQLEAGATVREVAAAGSAYFEALRYVPIFVESDPEHAFDGRWTRYARAVNDMVGADVVPLDWEECAMEDVDGAWSDGQLPSGRTPCSAFPVPTAVGDDGVKPGEFTLAQNYPNPFNPATVLEFRIPAPGRVRLDIYNITGQHVRTLVDGVRAAGEYRIDWDGRDEQGRAVATGVYFYRLRTDSGVITRKMTLIK